MNSNDRAMIRRQIEDLEAAGKPVQAAQMAARNGLAPAIRPGNVTIADLAQFARLVGHGYRDRTDELVMQYRHERATELESDVHDNWARVRFTDGSELIIRNVDSRPDNARAVDWAAPDALAQLERIAATLR